MDKTGEVREGVTRCDFCGDPAVTVEKGVARCGEHLNTRAKEASLAEASATPLKAFTRPLPGHGG